MQDITELERRIAAAFDRIDRGLEQADRVRATVSALSSDTSQQDAVQAATARADELSRNLDLAKANNVEWSNRYAALQAQMADATNSMTDEIAKLTQDIASITAELKAALSNPPADQALQELQVNLSAQTAELAQLRAARAIEIEELQAIVAALTPLIDEAKPNA